MSFAVDERDGQHCGREAVDVRTAAKELGSRYVMEGSLRQAREFGLPPS